MTFCKITKPQPGAAICAAAAAVFVCLVCSQLSGQKLTEPVYRVANQDATPKAEQTARPAEAAAPQPAAAAPARPVFDLTQQPGEHPLAPVIRVCKASLEHVNKNVTDYSCTLVKRERLDGELGDPQQILLRVKHEPFSVYMLFRTPHAGREVLFVDGKNKNELIVREAGLLSIAGKVSLHPESTMAMSGQKYPITKIGMRNLLSELIRNFESDTKYAESEVTLKPDIEFNKRSTTMIQVSHPVPRQNFRSHIARVFFDNELRVPIYYDGYLWPIKEGEAPPLEESYAYTSLKVNNGFTAKDFDAEGGEIFK
jgi:hypothetical protein